MNRPCATRAFHVLLLIAVLLGVEGARLAWVQMGLGGSQTASGTLVQRAVMQRTDSLVVDSGRGQFRDRNGKLLTGETVQSLAAFPDYGMKRGTDEALGELAEALKTDSRSLEDWLAGLRVPEVWRLNGTDRALGLTDGQVAAVRKARLLGVTVLPYAERYPSDVTPIHAIGYVSQHPEWLRDTYGAHLAEHRLEETSMVGGAGLERSLDRFLQGVGTTAVLQVTDAAKRPLEGKGLRTMGPDNPHFPLQVTTTLDLNAQEIAEEVLKDHGIANGAVVVLSAGNADVLAMASLPKLDPYRIGAKTTDDRNHALTAYPPGSVFKTVTLAAALESGIATLSEKFICIGHYDKYGLKCWKKGGHGVITLEQAYAESCNVVFAGLAERMDPAWLQVTAERLGLGRQVGWSTADFIDGNPLKQLEEEEAGSIFLNRQTAEDGGVRAGTGIGQRDVRMTPLQAANMVVTLLRHGSAASPNLLKDIRYADGQLMTRFPAQSSESKYGQIKARTAAMVLDGMRDVVTDGTASAALKDAKWPLAGKSGTAELDGKQKARNDHWFVGYGPARGTPRYAVAVLLEDQPAGLRNRAADVFGDVMEQLRLLDARYARERAEGR